MKKTKITFYVVIVNIFLYIGNVEAQVVHTCIGTPVSVVVNQEFDIAVLNYIQQQSINAIQTQGLNVQQIGPASHQYNCHSYAWFMSEGVGFGEPEKAWMFNVGFEPTSDANGCIISNSNIDKYWQDGCYIQVCNEADADKVHYWCGDHSATRSLTYPNLWESKWGDGPKFLHSIENVDASYKPNFVHYYASTKINGNTDSWCFDLTPRLFSVKNITGATYTWSCSSNLILSGNANSNNISLSLNSLNTSGAGFIQVIINTPCSPNPVTKRIDFYLGVPNVTGALHDNNGSFLPLIEFNRFNPIPNLVCSANLNTTDMLVSGASNLIWSLQTTSDPSLGWYVNSPNLNYWFSNSNYTAKFNLTASNGNNCITSKSYLFQSVDCNSTGLRLLANPIPANSTSNLNVSLMYKGFDNVEIEKNILVIQMLDKVGLLIKETKYPTGIKKLVMPLLGLKPDIYTIRAYDGKNWIAKQVIVQ
jgi:hypothetical protein